VIVSSAVVFNELPAPSVFLVRGAPVLLDEDVARFFGVKTSRLNEQVKRNLDRFGGDFAFELSPEEWEGLKSQNATSSAPVHGGRRKPPRAFTEHGIVMAATVLRSERAIAASRFIISIFVEARRHSFAESQASNLPRLVNARSVLPLAADARHNLVAKLSGALTRVLDAIADPVAQTTVRDEAQAVVAEGLNAIKEIFRKQGVQNEKTLAEAHKLFKEAEAIDADIRSRHIDDQHRQLAYLAKQLRMVIEIQRYLDTGTVEGLLGVLKDLAELRRFAS
jgi:hypothetical protein